MNARWKTLCSSGCLAATVLGLAVSAATGQDIVYTIPGPAGADFVGYSLATLGDWNGDGTADLAVGIPADGSQPIPGRVQIHSGRDGSLLFTLSGGGPSTTVLATPSRRSGM